MGPGMLFKAVLPRGFSLTVFGLSQVMIDLEPLYYMLRDAPPLHRFFHTYMGAFLVGLLVIAVARPICEWLLRFWNSRLSEAQARLLAVNTSIGWRTVVFTAMVGVFSHVFFDSFMHGDIRPFSPFSEGNGLVSLLSVSEIYLACVIAGIVGLFIYAVYGFAIKQMAQRAK